MKLKQKVTPLLNCLTHQENRRIFNLTSSESFDSVIRASGHQYIPEVYNQQMQWLRNTYYKTTGSQKPIFFRIFKGDLPDHQTTAQEVHHALGETFGSDLDPVLKENAVYLLRTTIAQKYHPSSEPFLNVEGSHFRNTYKPPQLVPTEQVLVRPKIWQEYLNRFMPPNNLCTLANGYKIKEQDYFEGWIAQRIQDPSATNTAVMVLRGEQGTGKGIWADVMMKELLGKSNYQAVSLDQLTGKFVDGLYSKTLVQVEEVIINNRPKITEQLKLIATQEHRWVEGKNRNGHQADKHFGLYLSTNHREPVKVEKDDRRFFIPAFSEHKHSPEESDYFFSKFVQWLEQDDGFQIMLNFLSCLDISQHSFRRPPMTESKSYLMEHERSPDQKAHRVSIYLADHAHRQMGYTLEVVQEHWRLTPAYAKMALQKAGYASKRLRWIIGEPPFHLWVHEKTFDGNKENIEMFDPKYKQRPSFINSEE